MSFMPLLNEKRNPYISGASREQNPLCIINEIRYASLTIGFELKLLQFKTEI